MIVSSNFGGGSAWVGFKNSDPSWQTVFCGQHRRLQRSHLVRPPSRNVLSFTGELLKLFFTVAWLSAATERPPIKCIPKIRSYRWSLFLRRYLAYSPLTFTGIMQKVRSFASFFLRHSHLSDRVSNIKISLEQDIWNLKQTSLNLLQFVSRTPETRPGIWDRVENCAKSSMTRPISLWFCTEFEHVTLYYKSWENENRKNA